jgi:FKBP-type peptidyl-prolyl cis-trans isomerase (trigger factor)
MLDQLDQLKEIKLSDEDLQGLYMYLAMNYENFSQDEKAYWNIIMEILDPEYNYED